jgi:hypothetical protein
MTRAPAFQDEVIIFDTNVLLRMLRILSQPGWFKKVVRGSKTPLSFYFGMDFKALQPRIREHSTIDVLQNRVHEQNAIISKLECELHALKQQPHVRRIEALEKLAYGLAAGKPHFWKSNRGHPGTTSIMHQLELAGVPLDRKTVISILRCLASKGAGDAE